MSRPAPDPIVPDPVWPRHVPTDRPCPDCPAWLEQVPGSTLLACPDCGAVRFLVPAA